MWGQAGPLPIPLSEVQAYLSIVNITDREERAKLMRLVRKMDQAELKYLHEKTKR